LKRRSRNENSEQGQEKTLTENDQKQLGKTLWNIADQLRGAMYADELREYMLAFLFLRYRSDNYAQAGKIDFLKTHKRGLMQQLFPAPEEQ